MNTPTFVPKNITCHKCNEKFTPSNRYIVVKREIPRYKCPNCKTKHMIAFKKGGGIRAYEKCFLKDCDKCSKARKKFS